MVIPGAAVSAARRRESTQNFAPRQDEIAEFCAIAMSAFFAKLDTWRDQQRDAHGKRLSVTAFVKSLGVGESTYRSWAKSAPGLEMLVKIAASTEICVQYWADDSIPVMEAGDAREYSRRVRECAPNAEEIESQDDGPSAEDRLRVLVGVLESCSAPLYEALEVVQRAVEEEQTRADRARRRRASQAG